jgi:hypothetical protein
VGIDLGFVALEFSQLATAMNAFAFGAQAGSPWMLGAAVTLGVAIPAMIFAMTKVGALLWTDCHARTA